MKNHTRKITLFMLLAALPLLVFSMSSSAENALPEADKNMLEQAGVPVYPGLQYVMGSFSGIVGVRFATSDSVEKVREWYRGKLPSWALNDEYGSWILYNGKPGAGPGEYMSKNQVMVAENKNLADWYGVPADQTTEVLIALPEVSN